ncbi:MAG: hypothetical protein JNM08_10935 [Rubrivivax sp.]|nr:hypothetical protein [Rubrivivax sp.]
MQKLSPILALCAALAVSVPMTAFAADKATCEKSADDKKLAGAARNSHIKKCMGDGAGGNAACEKSADDKKLAGAARTSHIKKCVADAGGKPAAAAASGAKK